MSDEDFIHEVNIPGYFGDIFDFTYVYNFAADMPDQLTEVANMFSVAVYEYCLEYGEQFLDLSPLGPSMFRVDENTSFDEVLEALNGVEIIINQSDTEDNQYIFVIEDQLRENFISQLPELLRRIQKYEEVI